MPIDSLPPPFPLALRVLLRRICLTPFGCAYSGAPIEAALATKNVEPQINEPERSGDRQPQAARRVSAANQKGTRGHPLTDEQKASNREKSRTRSRVEHVFAQMSGSMKALYQRCIGMKRNVACLQLTNLVYNMLRLEQIKRLNLNAAA
ncbi:MAG: transposase [Verrucomicrobiaceae bacterium]|nr:transposase [Verrucomicrobiaceae bacterium]